ncbi:MAG: hypothetical protein ABH816_02020 [Candidatus Levyibacteriota bacterium]
MRPQLETLPGIGKTVKSLREWLDGRAASREYHKAFDGIGGKTGQEITMDQLQAFFIVAKAFEHRETKFHPIQTDAERSLIGLIEQAQNLETPKGRKAAVDFFQTVKAAAETDMPWLLRDQYFDRKAHPERYRAVIICENAVKFLTSPSKK